MSAQEPKAAIGLLYCDDFMWTSRIAGTAKALGRTMKAVKTLEQLEEAARDQEISAVIIDLGASNVSPQEVVQRVRALCNGSPRFAAFGSHVDVESLRQAREAGCDPVLPRSQFAERLSALMEEWLA